MFLLTQRSDIGEGSELAAPRSLVKHSTTEPLRSQWLLKTGFTVLLLLFSGVFSPTLFSKVFGDLACDKCIINSTGFMNETTGFQCTGCRSSVVG